MKHKIVTLSFIFLLLAVLPLHAQMNELTRVKINTHRLALQKKGMVALGSWAVGNIALSGTMMAQQSGAGYYFHQMNVMWNAVNLGIATTAYFSIRKRDPYAYTTWETLEAYHNTSKTFLFNTGLDAAYIMAGMYMKERAKSAENTQLWKGYGNSAILQGSFLLAFDAVMFFLNEDQRKRFINPDDIQIIIMPGQMGMRWSF